MLSCAYRGSGRLAQALAPMGSDLFARAIFSLIFVAVGAFLIIGARKRWAWLVDPPSYLWFCYTQSLYKAIFGSEGCRVITLYMGAIFVCVGGFFFVQTFL